MDLLPGPDELAAVERLQPLLAAQLGVPAWAERLRAGTAVDPTFVAEAGAAGVFDAPGITAEVVVFVELGRHLAPVGLLAAVLAAHAARERGDETARAEVAALRAMTYVMISRIARQDLPGPEGSLVKLFSGDVSQRVHALAVDVLGVDGLRFVADDGAFSYGYLASLAATIGGGTSEIQRNIVAERLLGLPR